MKTLPPRPPYFIRLVLKKVWFDAIKSGEKKVEYRSGTPYYDSRFLGRRLDGIEFSCGYTSEPDKVMRFKIDHIERIKEDARGRERTVALDAIDEDSVYAIHLGERIF